MVLWHRRWYFGLSHGRVGRRQNKSSLLHAVLTKCNSDIKTEFNRPRGGFLFIIFYGIIYYYDTRRSNTIFAG